MTEKHEPDTALSPDQLEALRRQLADLVATWNRTNEMRLDIDRRA